MSNLENLVKSTVLDFVATSTLFTALDVSNKVKEHISYARHREVRDLVRSLFASHLEPAGYTKTPISVTLKDGSIVDAILYHHLDDSWDLDSKYDFQKRSQVSSKLNNEPALPSNTPPPTDPNSELVEDLPLKNTPFQLWESLFKSRPSLFPRK